MSPLYAFLGVQLVLVVLLVWFVRRMDLVDSMAVFAKENVHVYARGTTMILIATFSAFSDALRDLTAEVVASMGWWQWACLFFTPTISGLTVLAAFLDRSTTNLTKNLDKGSPSGPQN